MIPVDFKWSERFVQFGIGGKEWHLLVDIVSLGSNSRFGLDLPTTAMAMAQSRSPVF